MKGLEAFLAELRGLGVKLWVEGDKLRLRAPEGMLGPELMDALKERKAEILALLQPRAFYSIPAVASQDSYELSAAQRRLWILAQFPNGSAAYNIPLHQRLEGSLDRAALEAAFVRLVQRHESLRTTFVSVGGEPRQVVRSELHVPFELRDIASLDDPEEIARELGREQARQVFDLAAGPLFSACLLKLGEDRHVLLFTISHIIADGVSLGVLARDLSRLYESARSGRPDDLPELAIGYPAYAAWQNRLLNGELMAPHRKYWHELLSGELPVLNLPTDYPRPPVQTFRGRELSFTMGREQLEALHAFCRERNASLFMVLHAALKALLFAYTGQEDIIIGCAIAGREHVDLADQIGFYLNTLALRSRIRREAPFEEFFGEVVQLTKASFDHQIYPFDQLVGEVNVTRDVSRSPLFDVMLVLQNQDEPGLCLDGIRAQPVFEHPETSKFDLTFCFKAMPSGLILGIEYSTDLFCEDRIRWMGGHFLELIGSILANPSESVGRLNLLPEDESRRLLYELNRTDTPYPRNRTIVQSLETAAAKTPDAVAVVCGRRHLTYRELHARSNQLARHLRELGIGPDTPVGIYVERSPELVIALLGVLKAGGAYVPLDPRFPADRVADILEDAQVSVLMVGRGGRDFPTRGPMQKVDLDSDWNRIAQRSADPPPWQVRPDHLAYIIYTSGTTGKPKGVQIPHRALANFLGAMAQRPGLTQRDILLAVTTISFDIAGLEIYLPLSQGARVVLAEDADVGDGTRLMALLAGSGTTVMQATPATWQMLLAAGWQGNPALKVICGGEALPGGLAEQLLARSESVWNMYGPTETTVWSTCRKLDRKGTPRDPVESIGRPIANTEIYILDQDFRPVPIGVPGELYIGGDGLAAGYRNRPELNAGKFLPHPFARDPNRRVYKTGDIARYRGDGDIEYLGRTDQQVKLRGFRIELAEIEAVLATHPDIQQAIVDVRDDAAGDKQLVAWYVSSHGQSLAPAQLRDHLKRTLPDYMVPAIFVGVASLPITPNGKVHRQALAEPDRDLSRTAAYAMPRSDWEQRLARLWEEVLNIPRVGIHDNFLELGGHSLKAAAFVARLQRETGVHLNLVDVFRHPTVAELAAHSEGGSNSRLPAIGPAAIAGARMLPTEAASAGGEAGRRGIRPATAEELEMLSRS